MDIRKGSIVQVECTGLGHNGEGVCRYDGLALFVPLVLPGEKAIIKITEVKKRYGIGQLVEILEKSNERVDAPCPCFGVCGGCQLQHLSYQGQLRWKRKMVDDAFVRIGHLENTVADNVVGMKSPWNYRNKMQLPVSQDESHLSIGCYQQGSHKVIDTPDCMIQNNWNNHLLKRVKNFFEEIKIEVYSEKEHTGWLRHVMGRSNRKDEGILIIVGKTSELPGGDDLWIQKLKNIPGIKGILMNINPEKTNTILGKETRLVWGEETLQENLEDLEFSLSGTAFFQVNPTQTEVLYDHVRKFADLSGNEKVLDAYCGTGTIAVYLAAGAKEVLGIERHLGAIKDAKKNATENKINNCEFWAGNIEKYLEKIRQMEFDVIVVDPPRSGCSPETLQTLHNVGAKKMVYVSCNPSTLARDCAWLVQQGWAISKVQPVDMFPQTSHVECVVLMTRF